MKETKKFHELEEALAQEEAAATEVKAQIKSIEESNAQVLISRFPCVWTGLVARR